MSLKSHFNYVLYEMNYRGSIHITYVGTHYYRRKLSERSKAIFSHKVNNILTYVNYISIFLAY